MTRDEKLARLATQYKTASRKQKQLIRGQAQRAIEYTVTIETRADLTFRSELYTEWLAAAER